MANAEPKLWAPGTIALTARSWLGPLAGLGRRTAGLPATAVTLVNTGRTALTWGGPALDPLRNADTGVAAPGALTARLPPGATAPGAAVPLVIEGTTPSRPGAYASTLRFPAATGGSGEDRAGEDGAGEDGAVAVPVTVGVAASAAWGILFMLLGLVTVASVSLLSTEGALRSRQADIILARQALHERVEQDPLPSRNQGDLGAIDREYAAALDALMQPRPAGFVDHRMADAEPHIAVAAKLQADLEKTLAGHEAGEAVSADLEAAWSRYGKLADALARSVPPIPPAGAADAGSAAFDAAIGRYESRFARRFLLAPIGYDRPQLEQIVLGAQLAAASGRVDDTRRRARTVQEALRNSLDRLARDRDLVQQQRLLGFNLGFNASQIRTALAAEPVDPAALAAVFALLDQANATLANAGQDEDQAFLAANRLVSQAQTAGLAARLAVRRTVFQAAIDATGPATGLDDVDAAAAAEQAQPHDTPVQKIAGLRRVMAVWQDKIAGIEPSARPSLEAARAAVSAALDAGDLSAVGARYKALTDAWAAWGSAFAIRAGYTALVPGCRLDTGTASIEAGQIAERLRQLRPMPQRAGWADRLTAASDDLNAFDPAGLAAGGQDCATALFAITTRLFHLGGEIFAAETADAPIPPSERRQALLEAGLDVSRPGPRSLALDILTPDAELVTHRAIRFALTGAPQNWRESDTVRVEFGDGSAPFLATLGAVRHDADIVHSYATVPKEPIRVMVTEQAGSGEAPVIVGQGAQTIPVAPSPATAARRLSDGFLNARFALSLLVASVIYTWRFHTGKKLFGAHGFDYVEAFAVGFVVNAAVGDLPAQVVRIVSAAGG